MNLPVIFPGLLLLAVGAGAWARWLHRRRSGVPGVVRHVPLVMVIVVMTSLGLTVWGLQSAYLGLSGDASERASRLAEGISVAMNATAAGYGAVLLTLVLLAVMTLRSHRRAQSTER